MAALDSIMSNMPIANARRQEQQKAAADLQLQQAVAKAPPKTAPAVAQQVGAAAAQNAGAQAIDAAKQNIQQSQQVGQLALQQKQSDIQNNIAALKRGVESQQMRDEREFANINEQAKQEMFDNRMQFQTDEMGRQFLNERQLADYAVSHARDVEQLRNYSQDAEQLYSRQMQSLEAAQNKINQELQFQNSLSIQQQDQVVKRQLVEAKAALDRKIARDKANAANRSGVFSTVVGVAGAAAGAYAGSFVGQPVAGAMIGYQAGSAIGNYAANNTNL